MTLTLAPPARADAAGLIAANAASRRHHEPWAQPFTDPAGFEAWFTGLATGAAVGLVARDAASGSLVGVVNLSGIMLGRFAAPTSASTAWPVPGAG